MQTQNTKTGWNFIFPGSVNKTQNTAVAAAAGPAGVLSRDPAALEIGRVLLMHGYNYPEYVIIADNGNYYECINLTEYSYIRREKFGLSWPGERLGIHVQITDKIKTAAEIEALKQKVIESDLARDKEKKQKEAAAAALKIELTKEYNFLLRSDDEKAANMYGGKLGAKNIRTELKNNFPGEKFSVRSSYDCINISWKNPDIDRDKVENICDKYQIGNFNGMEDIYEYNTSIFNSLFGGAKYVFCQYSNY